MTSNRDKNKPVRVGRTASKGEKMSNRNTIRTSVSFSPQVYEWAQGLAFTKGFDDNFSGYLADLIRRDRLEQEEREARMKAANPDRGN